MRVSSIGFLHLSCKGTVEINGTFYRRDVLIIQTAVTKHWRVLECDKGNSPTGRNGLFLSWSIAVIDWHAVCMLMTVSWASKRHVRRQARTSWQAPTYGPESLKTWSTCTSTSCFTKNLGLTVYRQVQVQSMAVYSWPHCNGNSHAI